MVRLRVLFVALAAPSAMLLAACWGELPADADVCTRAKYRISTCGASVPVFDEGPCTGTNKLFAQCVTNHAATCTELATLITRVDECMADLLDGGDPLLPPPVDLPVPPRDGSADGATREDAAPAPVRDAGPADAPVLVDATVDSGAAAPWSGLDATGTVLRDEERRYATPALPAGTYTFTLAGNGDADLYVRRGVAPTTALYDCRPFKATSAETCTVTLAASSEVHVMVRGAATTSTFTLEGRP